VSGFALGLVTEVFPLGSGEAIEKSDRYAVGSLSSLLLDFGSRSIKSTAIVYPYWENAARVAEDFAALSLAAAVVLLLFPADAF
jgi:hypothetical protein